MDRGSLRQPSRSAAITKIGCQAERAPPFAMSRSTEVRDQRCAWFFQSLPSSARGMSIVAVRDPFGRPAIPIDIAAPAYQTSVLKITRLIFFLDGRARDKDFLALVDLEVLFFDICAPTAPCTPISHISRARVGVTVAPKKSLSSHPGRIIFLNY